MTKFLLHNVRIKIQPDFDQNDSLVAKGDDAPFSAIEFDDGQLNTLREDNAFNYEVENTEYSWWEGLKNWLYNLLNTFFEWIFGVDAAPEYIAAFLKYVPYLLLGVFLYLIIRFFIKANSKNLIFSKSNENMVVLSEEERIIKSDNIQALINEALEQRNYRLAVRYYYLFVLKLLAKNDLIQWELQKTNDDYLKELSTSRLRPLFEKATQWYDHVWYGEFNLNQIGFEKAKNSFDELKKGILTNV